jgi:hypothetical protein
LTERIVRKGFGFDLHVVSLDESDDA